MAKKKEPSIQDAIAIFQDVLNRIGVDEITYENNTILVKTNKKSTVMIIMDQTLWNALFENDEFKNKCIPINATDKVALNIANLSSYNDWINVDIQEFQNGKIINVSVEGYDYPIPISKDNLPLKLKKSEMSDIGYQISSISMSNIVNKVLMIRKYFEGCIPNTSFSIISLFIII